MFRCSLIESERHAFYFSHTPCPGEREFPPPNPQTATVVFKICSRSKALLLCTEGPKKSRNAICSCDLFCGPAWERERSHQGALHFQILRGGEEFCAIARFNHYRPRISSSYRDFAGWPCESARLALSLRAGSNSGTRRLQRLTLPCLK